MSFNRIPTRCEIGGDKPGRSTYKCHGQIVKVCGFWICEYHARLADLIAEKSLRADHIRRQKVAA